ncbi:MAG: aminoacyl-tRNA hydrolase [Candidatus Saccharibacteria bacterium]|nr:aminoacyl-tRNA hydrolase [Candidatus Saccharibacteria bacterium]
MKMVVGLGNPGGEYNFTRHNFGFLALDFYFRLNDLSWGSTPRYGAITGRRGDVLFVKPQNFYNDSGRSVAEIARYYKIATSDILVICDNFDLDFGKIRSRETGSAGGNNGLKSVTSALGTDNYPRIRLGTGNEELRRKMGDVEFVLSRFTAEEKEQLPEILRAVAGKIDEFCGL